MAAVDNILTVIIILLLFVISGVTIWYVKKRYGTEEHYSDRFKDLTIDECAGLCKTTTDCYAFAYDSNKKTCYPSYTPLIGRPPKQVFGEEYSPNNTVCNKIIPITIADRAPGFEQRRANAVYTCAEREGLQPILYFHNKSKFNKFDEGQNVDFIKQVDEYEVKDHRWPNNQYDTDNTDILNRDINRNNINDQTVTDIDRIRRNPTGVDLEIQQQKDMDFLGFSVNKIKSTVENITNIFKPSARVTNTTINVTKEGYDVSGNNTNNTLGLPDGVNNPTTTTVANIPEPVITVVDISNTGINKNIPLPNNTIDLSVNNSTSSNMDKAVPPLATGQADHAYIGSKALLTDITTQLQPSPYDPVGPYSVYKVNDQLNRGDYLMDHKCTRNVPLKTCLEYCENNKQCVGVEWNPKFSVHDGVCCPMQSIGKMADRESIYRFGKFYSKEGRQNLDTTKYYISL